MNIDRILETFGKNRVACMLIGGMNFLLRHAPVLTYDVDLWVEDTPENLDRCERALAELQAEWGASEAEWEPVAKKRPGWLTRQSVFCLTSPHGAIDIFRSVKGLASWAACRARAETRTTARGIAFHALSDVDMLACQMALPEGQQNQERIRALNEALRRTRHE
jgi:hypothetical protein